MPPSKTDVPALKWAANDHALAYALIDVLVQYPSLKSNIWPAPGDKVSGKPKSAHYQDLAARLLAEYEPYDNFVKTAEGRKTYGTSVGAQLRQMASKWRRARDALGVTGAGLNHETDIWEDEKGDKLRNIWTTVKQSCPYFYALKPLLGERMLVTDHAIHNSIDHIDTSSLLTRKLAVPETGAEPKAVPVNDNGDVDTNIREEDEVNSQDWPASPRVPTPITQSPIIRSLTPRSPLPPIRLSSPGPSHRRHTEKTATPGPVESSVAPKSSRAPKNAQMSDFAQLIETTREGAGSRKRVRDEGKLETQQLTVKRKFDLAEKKMQMKHEAKMGRMALKEKKMAIALEEKKIALQDREFISRQLQFQIKDATGASNSSLLDT